MIDVHNDFHFASAGSALIRFLRIYHSVRLTDTMENESRHFEWTSNTHFVLWVDVHHVDYGFIDNDGHAERGHHSTSVFMRISNVSFNFSIRSRIAGELWAMRSFQSESESESVLS